MIIDCYAELIAPRWKLRKFRKKSPAIRHLSGLARQKQKRYQVIRVFAPQYPLLQLVDSYLPQVLWVQLLEDHLHEILLHLCETLLVSATQKLGETCAYENVNLQSCEEV